MKETTGSLLNALLLSAVFLFAGFFVATSAQAAPPITAVQPASNISGEWQFFVTPSTGGFTSHTFTIGQKGNRFYSTNLDASYRIYGTINNNQIDISMVVNGEVLEGYVLHGTGHLVNFLDGEGRRKTGIVTVYQNSQGGVGSLNGQKQ